MVVSSLTHPTTYLDWIRAFGNPSNQRLLFGVMPAYPIFMFSGILLVIGLAIWHLRKRGIPLRDFELGLLITVPLGILGASIFGKIFLPNIIWYHVFFFWEPGMSLFGSFFFGFLAALSWFGYRAHATQISLWVYADCIVPHLLLGQLIGRWGNFYNHEILGNVTSYENLKWLPNFIRDQLFYFPNLSGFELKSEWWSASNLNEALATIATSGPFEGHTLEEVLTSPLIMGANGEINPLVTPYGLILYRQPLFLIEGLGNLALWILLQFALPPLVRIKSPKPWVVAPKAYPGRFNKQYRFLQSSEVESHATQLPIRYYRAHHNPDFVALTQNQAWNKAYYWYEPQLAQVRRLQGKQREIQQQTETHLQQQIKNNSSSLIKIREKMSHLVQGNPIGKELERLHNPAHYRVLRAGALASGYIIGYLTLRIILETQRTRAELMIPHHPIATFILLSLVLIMGVLLFILAQWIAPYRYREIGWLYEKSY